MADEQLPFADVRREGEAVSIPDLKWRELLFIGALRPAAEAGTWERDASRPMPPFRDGELFPEGIRLRAERRAGRVLLRRI